MVVAEEEEEVGVVVEVAVIIVVEVVVVVDVVVIVAVVFRNYDYESSIQTWELGAGVGVDACCRSDSCDNQSK